MKTYGQALDDQLRAFGLLARPIPFRDETGALVMASSAAGSAQAVLTADTYFLGEDFVDLVDAASQSLPEDARASLEDFPSETGWMSLAKPPEIDWLQAKGGLWVTDRQDPDAAYAAMAARCQANPPNGLFWSAYPGIAAITLFSDRFPGPMARMGFRLDDHVPGASAVEKWVKTLWILLGQRNVSEMADEEPPRQARKRASRMGIAVPSIRVIRLPRKVREESTREHGAVDWKHRWIVQGHWTNQPYGPGLSKRRKQWIAPYIKGPEDKPLKPVARRLFVAEKPVEER